MLSPEVTNAVWMFKVFLPLLHRFIQEYYLYQFCGCFYFNNQYLQAVGDGLMGHNGRGS